MPRGTKLDEEEIYSTEIPSDSESGVDHVYEDDTSVLDEKDLLGGYITSNDDGNENDEQYVPSNNFLDRDSGRKLWRKMSKPTSPGEFTSQTGSY